MRRRDRDRRGLLEWGRPTRRPGRAPPPTTAVKRATYRLDSTLRLNQMQVLGSHNSYHAEPYPQVLAAAEPRSTPAVAAGLDYGHRPLPEQFDARRSANSSSTCGPTPPAASTRDPPFPQTLHLPPPDPAVMDKPGFKVIHDANLDTHSTCLTFVLCLRLVKTWSDAHPGHVPIMIDVEMKDSTVTPATFDALEAEIRSVLAPSELITPDDVRGNDPSLGHAIRTRGWPTLGAVRGRVMFMLDNENFAAGRAPWAIRRSAAGSCSRRRRRATTTPPSPSSTTRSPTRRRSRPRSPRTCWCARAPTPTRCRPARTDTTMRDSRARERRPVREHRLRESPTCASARTSCMIPGGTPARCNPVTAPPTCTSTDVEDPKLLTATP